MRRTSGSRLSRRPSPHRPPLLHQFRRAEAGPEGRKVAENRKSPCVRAPLFEVLAILLVFGAEVFEQVFVRNQALPLRVRDEFAVGLGIVDRHIDVEMAGIGAPKSLDYVQIGAVWMAHTIEPSAIPESFTVDNQRIAFPAADGVAHPSRVRVRRECTAIKKDLTVYSVLLVKNDDEIRRLDDLVRQW